MSSADSQPGTAAVVVVGELLVDIVRTPDGEVAEHVGGSPANVAMGLARLGHATELACLVGTDDRGRRCTEHVEAAGVALTQGSVSSTHPTSTAVATIGEQRQATYTFDLHWDLPPVVLAEGTGHVHTGSIATTLQPGAAQVTDALQRGRELGTISYDPNMRPSIMGSPDAVRPRVEELVSLADVVKCSDEDLAWLYPGTPVEEVLARWGDLGASFTLVTRGGEGVHWRLPGSGESGSEPASDVIPVDTVGAGDSFMAGLVSGLLDAGLLGSPAARERLRAARADDIRPAVARGARTSGITVTHAGAYAPTREEL